MGFHVNEVDARNRSRWHRPCRLSAQGIRIVIGAILAFSLGAIGCGKHLDVASNASPSPTPAASPAPPAILIVADGAGNFQACSRAMRSAAKEKGLPLEIRTCRWSHGYMRILSDQLGYRHAQNEGAKLAAEVNELRRAQPQARIFLMGHSAGSTVILSALENLPPGAVEQAFLLSPSVSSRYEIVPALRNVGTRLHVYYSEHDFWHLGLAMQMIGTQDRMFLTSAAGRKGFAFEPRTEEERALAAKLHQHRWEPSDLLLGNDGGHFGAYRSEYASRRILPWIFGENAGR